MRDKIGQPLEIGDIVITYIPDYYVLSEPNIVIGQTKKKIRLGVGRLLRDADQCIVVTEIIKASDPEKFAALYQKFSKVLDFYSVDEERERIRDITKKRDKPTHTRYLCLLQNPDYIYMYEPCHDKQFTIDVYELHGSDREMKELIKEIRYSYDVPIVQLKARKAKHYLSGDSKFRLNVTQQRKTLISLFDYEHTTEEIEVNGFKINKYTFNEKPDTFYK